ncbi:MAG: lamin tail domain-containing protein [bacterium]|nr:lamin tail domain-containing protein [bacterium]
MWLFLLIFLLWPQGTVNAAYQDVVFSEIAWMGTQESSADEWIELYNNTASGINVSGWKIIAEDGIPSIILDGEIPAKACYLLERTNDNSTPVISQQIYTGALENNGEILKLLDNNGDLIDKVNAENGWPAGDNAGGLTMARALPVEKHIWVTGSVPEGTPGIFNNIYQPEIITLLPSPATALKTANSPLPSPDKKQKIVITEALTTTDKNIKSESEQENSGSTFIFEADVAGTGRKNGQVVIFGLLIAGLSGIIIVFVRKLI